MFLIKSEKYFVSVQMIIVKHYKKKKQTHKNEWTSVYAAYSIFYSDV